MFNNIVNFFKNIFKTESQKENTSGKEAKERLHLVLMQDRANVSADFLEMMKQEIIEVIKKYIDVDENAIDVKLTNKTNEDGTNGAPALYANIPIISIKEENKNIIATTADTDEKEKETNNEEQQNEEKIIKEDENIEPKKENEEEVNNNEEDNKTKEV